MLGFCLALIDEQSDKDKFKELYYTYRQDMYKVAFGILKNSADAEDAVEQAFLSIANNFDRILEIPKKEIKAYIVIVIRNTAINLYNKNKRITEHSTTLNDNNISVQINALENYEYEYLLMAIKKLPQKYKDIIYLYYLEEFSAKEISKMLNVNINTVYKRAERAKEILKNILEKGEYYEK